MPPPHSNLSPLSPDSPLFPDGLMTPLWIKKHLHLPSVVVGFYDLWDWHTEPGTKRETGPLASQVMIDPVERENDANLASEINSKRFKTRKAHFSVFFFFFLTDCLYM
jgi:hypothetical protein